MLNIFNRLSAGHYGKTIKENISFIQSGDYRYFLLLLCVFGEYSLKAKVIVARYLSSSLQRFSDNDIIKADAQMRHYLLYNPPLDWSRLQIKDLIIPQLPDEVNKAILVFASFNINGYLRERAVAALADYDMTLPYILLRLNDWVPEVRTAALKSFEQRVGKSSPGELYESLFFIKKLMRSGRAEHKSAIEKFLRTLSRHKEDLESGLTSTNPALRILCVKAVLSTGHPDFQRIFRYLDEETSPNARAIIYRVLLSHEKFNSRDILARALGDKYSKTRSYALMGVYEKYPEDVKETALKFLLDKKQAVRETARWIVKQFEPDFDFRNYYIEQMLLFPYSSVAGLAETGRKEDSALLLPYLNSDFEPLARVSMFGLMSLDSGGYKPRIVQMLADERPGVSKMVFRLLSNHGCEDCLDEIENIFYETRNAYSRFSCAKLLFDSSKWKAVLYILKAVSNDDEAIGKLANTKLLHWFINFNRKPMLPLKEQKQAFLKLIDEKELHLGHRWSEQLRFCVKNL